MAYTIQDEARQLLKDLNAPQTPQMIAAVEAWLSFENGYNNNPLGVTSGGSLVHYGNPYLGLQAAADLLKTGAHGYDKVVKQARAGNATGFLTALAASGWNAPNHYGTAAPSGRNRLMEIYLSILSGSYHIPAANSQGGGNPVGTTVSQKTPGVTYTAAEWNNFTACVVSRGHFSSAQGHGATIGASNVGDIVACATSNHINLSAITLTDFYGKTLSDLRDALAAKGVIPPLDPLKGIVPDLTTPIYFIGVILVGIIFILVGGLVLLKRGNE